jgi:hypothetical protein
MVMKKACIFLLLSLQLLFVACQQNEPQRQGEPLDYVFYLNPTNNIINPDTLFFSYTNTFNETGITLKKKKLPEPIQSIGLFSQLGRNPKVSLTKLYQLKEKISALSGSDVPLAVFVDNKNHTNLSVVLPPYLPTSLYMTGHHFFLKSNTNSIKHFVVGVDLSKIALYVDMRFDYSKNIIPTTVSIQNNMSVLSCLLVESDLYLDDGALSFDEKKSEKGLLIETKLELYNSRIFAKKLSTDAKKKILFYGNTSIECQKKSLIKNNLHLQPEDQCFASDISNSSNNSIVKLKNVIFKPKSIFYMLNPLENKGYFDIDGDVELTHTTLKILVTNKKIPENFLGKRIPIILSTHNIRGHPLLDVEFLYDETKDDYVLRFEKHKNNAYISVFKKN